MKRRHGGQLESMTSYQIRPRRLMTIYLENIPAKSCLNLIGKDGALSFFGRGYHLQEEKEEQDE